jgi:flagellar hook-basal body complex protein FliE
MDVQMLPIRPIAPPVGETAPTAAGGAASFGRLLGEALGTLERIQAEADTLTGAVAAGEPVDLHEMTLALEQASLATQLAVQVRNKLIEAYQEIARMQV